MAGGFSIETADAMLQKTDNFIESLPVITLTTQSLSLFGQNAFSSIMPKRDTRCKRFDCKLNIDFVANRSVFIWKVKKPNKSLCVDIQIVNKTDQCFFSLQHCFFHCIWSIRKKCV